MSSGETIKAQRDLLFLSIFSGGKLKKEVDAEVFPPHSSIPHEPVAYSQWLHRVEQRLKQVEMGKNSIGYARYRSRIARHLRKAVDPKTPKVADDKISKKVFDETMKTWRRQLHVFSIGEGDVKEPAAKPAANAPLLERSVHETGQEGPTFIAPDLLPTAYDVLDSLYPQRKNLKQKAEINHKDTVSLHGLLNTEEKCENNDNNGVALGDDDERYRKRPRSISGNTEKESVEISKVTKQARVNSDTSDQFAVDYGQYSDQNAVEEKDEEEYNDYDYEADGYLDVADCCNAAFGVYHGVDEHSGLDRYGVRGLANVMLSDMIASAPTFGSSLSQSSPSSSSFRNEGALIDLSVGSFVCPPLVGNLPLDEKFAKKWMLK